MDQDGEVTYWQVQAQFVDKSPANWFFPIDALGYRLYNKKGAKNPDNLPTASGTCWQMWGIPGVLNKKAGISWVRKLKRLMLKHPDLNRPRMKFRLVKITQNKKTEVEKGV